MQVTVECQKRPEGTKPHVLRREGLIPAAIYGHNGAESISMALKAKDTERLLKKASVNNTLVDVNIPHVPWRGRALIRDVQTHPWKKWTVYHLSFFAVAGQESLEVVVPLNLVGEAVGVERESGVLEQTVSELQVQCAPDQIPESIDIDISDMHLGTSMHVSELSLPEGITVMDDPEQTVLTIIASRAAVEKETAEEETSVIGEVESEISDIGKL
ncbi:MAG: 50S ribosomal protein L25 [Cyanobacteria bacterium QH_2_48_84]|nr:MAG: 50S ribosomal protein L25 [Cyanobacteria bacterium QH_2_48_84]PSP08673.1 MAG: 50S ribosomal protein L25 [Cyanobacteria bacterium SW_7_48_12]